MKKTQEERKQIMRMEADNAMRVHRLQVEEQLGREMTDAEQNLYGLGFRSGYNTSIYETIEKVAHSAEERDELARRYYEHLENYETSNLC